MARATTKSRGRPATGRGTPIQVRVQPDLLADLDTWIAEQRDPKLSRPEAIRLLLADSLVGLGIRKP